MPRILGSATSVEATALTTVLVPVGSTEQHGPHLPLETDTIIAKAVSHRLAARLGQATVAPAITYGSSGEHQAFAGTSSIGADALRLIIVELTRSLSTWSDRVIFVNGHGGNVEPLTLAVEQLVMEGHNVQWVPCAVSGADAHAGRVETSIMLYLRPGTVKTDRLTRGNTSPLSDLLPALIKDGVRSVSPNGVLGDPTGASSEEGHRLLHLMVALAHSKLSRMPTHAPA